MVKLEGLLGASEAEEEEGQGEEERKEAAQEQKPKTQSIRFEFAERKNQRLLGACILLQSQRVKSVVE